MTLNYPYTLAGWRFWLSLALVLLSVDYFPNLPDASLDSSWMNGISAALAQGAVPGRDLLFTYGPLAALTTGYAGPGFLIGVAVALAIAAHLTFMLQAVLGQRALVAALLLFVACPNNEALSFVYLALLPAALVAADRDGGSGLTERGRVAVPLWPALVLVPALVLAKLSFLPIGTVLLLFSLGWMLRAGRAKAAAAAVALVLIALTAWWMLGGQNVSDLPRFLFDGEIIRGYTSAMESDMRAAVGGVSLQFVETLLLYLVAVAVTALVVSSVAGMAGRVYVALALAAVFAVAIKAAVVRHGGAHSIIPWLLLPVLALVSSSGERLRRLRSALFGVGVSGMLLLGPVYSGDGRGLTNIVVAARDYAQSLGLDWQSQKRRPAFWANYLSHAPGAFLTSLGNPMPGLNERLDNAWQLARAIATGGESFSSSREAVQEQIRQACAIVPVNGIADIYPTAINCLLANNQQWSPRPVFQSYSAYTPLLLMLNRQHLTGQGAPEHLFFDVQPIDDRLPMMEEGASWTCIAARYQPVGPSQGRFLQLSLVNARACPEAPVKQERTIGFGEQVLLSCDRPRTLASFDFRPTLAGRLVGTFYKTRRLMIDVTTCDGEVASYRLVPGMVGLPFPISPLVESSQEFRRVFFDAAGDPGRRVASFVVREGVSESPVSGWDGRYTMRLHGDRASNERSVPE